MTIKDYLKKVSIFKFKDYYGIGIQGNKKIFVPTWPEALNIFNNILNQDLDIHHGWIGFKDTDSNIRKINKTLQEYFNG